MQVAYLRIQTTLQATCKQAVAQQPGDTTSLIMQLHCVTHVKVCGCGPESAEQFVLSGPASPCSFSTQRRRQIAECCGYDTQPDQVCSSSRGM